MDDGFQNPSLHKDVSLLVIDSLRAVGNGRVFPAGPLRAPLHVQLRRADALVVVAYRDQDRALRERLGIVLLLLAPAVYAPLRWRLPIALLALGLLAYMLVPRMPSLFWKWVVAISAAVLILFVGFSRVYENGHYLSDVLAGYALGLAWGALVYTVFEFFVIRRRV